MLDLLNLKGTPSQDTKILLVEDLGKSIGLSNHIQRALKKIKGICAKATKSYTLLTLTNKWNVPNSGSACSCWNYGAHDHSLPKCKVTKNQYIILVNKNKWEEENDKKGRGAKILDWVVIIFGSFFKYLHLRGSDERKSILAPFNPKCIPTYYTKIPLHIVSNRDSCF